MAEVDTQVISSYIESVINLNASSVADVSSVAASAAVEIAGISIPTGADPVTAFASFGRMRQQMVVEYISLMWQDYAQEFAGQDAAVALEEIARRNGAI
jgi:hypothetical protein